MFGTANRCDSELHSTAYRAERTERELGLTVVLNVYVVNILMGKSHCLNTLQTSGCEVLNVSQYGVHIKCFHTLN